jgi:hypothetical protein
MANPRIIDIPAISETHELATIPVSALVRAELDVQVVTAKQYPRDLVKFTAKADNLVEAHMELARKPEEGLNYALVKGGKIIEGPNARFAEIVAHCWGNLRVSRDMVSEEARRVVCESICHDLESNNAEKARCWRSIMYSKTGNRAGERYDDDLITVTANAAASIARRNAILAVIPKAYWWPLYLKARKLASGETKKEVSEAAKKSLDYFSKMKVSEAQVLRLLNLKKASEITGDHVATLRGIASAIASGETTAHAAFSMAEPKRESAIKEKPAAEQKAEKISKAQVSQIYTLIADLALESSEVPKAMKEIGHVGKLPDLPASLFMALAGALEQRVKK